ncbi:hypothetical protein [Gilvimarinus sp. 1_MG-2023]|uniref:hypothetical protein n=1 Tax=Gilvimarinus sp. 1_MG-2023 TaxID=3062638 RepID=UPI0026E24908|nr:hypothetical protein [Gilvimarinus sp. 1_MG-2023]MDO6745687.1 hypothetical protein [Gilvimarinus sp. 1_MG-2023]
MDSIKNLASEIEQNLRHNNFNDYADGIHLSIMKLDRKETILEGLSEIESACHIKAYGDLYLETLSGWEWPNKLSKLGSMCRNKKKGMLGA